MRVYLDASPVIYFVERVQPYAEQVGRRIGAAEIDRVVSQLTRLECRVGPLRDASATLLRQFDRFFADAALEIVELTQEVIDRATEIRAEYRFSTTDAIHPAAALVARCDVFLTNDHRLARFAGITIEAVEGGTDLSARSR